jgi:YidC/Oxa1 family membrane protein insertase
MAQQQQPSRRGFLIPFLILYTAFLAYLHFFAPKPTPSPEQTRTVLEQAQTLEREGRTQDTNVAVADRVKKLEQAINKYEDYYNQNKGSSDPGVAAEARKARFQQINIYDYLATTLVRSGTHWYDQAEGKLKDMENAFLGKTGTVTLEIEGKTETRTGDLGKIASQRLNAIRAARDVRNRDKITYRILDFLVGITGRSPDFSYFLALAFVVVFLKVLTFPFQRKQYQYQRDIMRIQPLIKEAQEKLKGRPPDEINKRIFQLYKENNVNLAGGCLPMLVLMCVLFPVFYMVRDFEYQFTYANFLWIGTEFSKKAWWLADNLAQFDVPLFIIYLLSTVVYSLMQPKPADPQQAQQQKMMMIMMPVMFGIFMWFGQWSSAFMLYWLVLNVVSMYQSWVLMKQFGLLSPAAASAGEGGGGSGEGPKPPAAPLEPMKGVKTKRQNNGGNGRQTPGGTPGRIRPRGSGRK